MLFRQALGEQLWQHGRIANGVVRDFDGTDIQCLRVNIERNLEPLAPVVGAVLLGKRCTRSRSSCGASLAVACSWVKAAKSSNLAACLGRVTQQRSTCHIDLFVDASA